MIHNGISSDLNFLFVCNAFVFLLNDIYLNALELAESVMPVFLEAALV